MPRECLLPAVGFPATFRQLAICNTLNTNTQWPNLLFNRLQTLSSTTLKDIAVVNQAAGGNRVLTDGLGPNALARFDRDVLAQSGVRYAMIFEGVNDIGTADTSPEVQFATYEKLIQAYQQIVTRIHALGIPVFGATITPFSAPANYTGQPYSHPERERTRIRVNSWIRTTGVFDAVLDFDKIVADPKIPSQLNPEYNTGDYLHLSVKGFQRIADVFPVGLFAAWEQGADEFR